MTTYALLMAIFGTGSAICGLFGARNDFDIDSDYRELYPLFVTSGLFLTISGIMMGLVFN